MFIGKRGYEKEIEMVHFTRQDLIRLNDKIRYEASGCHVWISAKDKGGYGKFRLNGKSERPHRVVWQVVNGTIPPGYVLRHTCNNKLCCNPKHMYMEKMKTNIPRP